MTASVCVIIPAYNAAATIAAAVRSALAEPQVAEVLVVDDASTDGSADAARHADDGTGRLTVMRFTANRGPSAARNAALAASHAPYVAILDSDDHFLPGRFSRLFAQGDWDLIADNIAFVRDDAGVPEHLPGEGATAVRPLGFTEFVDRNIPRPGRPRSELGFLKPLIRRDLLDRLALRYAEPVRLGEDFLLYAEALGRGARFTLVQAPGYVAIERAGSLSGRHRTADLLALWDAERALAARLALAPGERRVLARHAASVAAKYRHRRFLDRRREAGSWAAFAPLLADPGALMAVARGIARDKLSPPRPAEAPALRMLFAPEEFATSR